MHEPITIDGYTLLKAAVFLPREAAGLMLGRFSVVLALNRRYGRHWRAHHWLTALAPALTRYGAHYNQWTE